MIKKFARQYIDRKRLLSENPGLEIGSRSLIHQSSFELNNRISNDNSIINCQIGRYTYTGPRCSIVASRVGGFSSIASDVIIGTGGHPLQTSAALHPLFYLSRPDLKWDFVFHDKYDEFAATTIGHDVWLGAKVIVRDGITVGDGAVVGAGAVVVRDLEPFGIYGGVPARLIRFRFPDHVIEKLLALSWWHRSHTWIRANIESFSSVERLLETTTDDN